MFGYLLGIANKKPVLVKIDFNEKKSNMNRADIVDKKNASYLSSDYKIVEIVDEFLNSYVCVDLEIILNEKFIITENFKINELYEKKLVFFYLNKQRALENIYLLNSKATGTFKQYLLNGDLNGEISLKNGYLNGISKIYTNGILEEECEYKRNNRNGFYIKYDKDKNIIETSKWNNGIME
jgi:antitoxin component YwqK of YwqJK toxin-antitoxin module